MKALQYTSTRTRDSFCLPPFLLFSAYSECKIPVFRSSQNVPPSSVSVFKFMFRKCAPY